MKLSSRVLSGFSGRELSSIGNGASQHSVEGDETRSQMHCVQSCVMSHHCSGCVTTSLCTNSVLLVMIVTAVDVSSADREAGGGGFNPVLVNNQVTQSTRVSVLYLWLPFPLCGVMVTGSV